MEIEHDKRTALKKKQGEIEEKKPKPAKVGESVEILAPSNDKNLKMIKYYNPKNVSGHICKIITPFL